MVGEVAGLAVGGLGLRVHGGHPPAHAADERIAEATDRNRGILVVVRSLRPGFDAGHFVQRGLTVHHLSVRLHLGKFLEQTQQPEAHFLPLWRHHLLLLGLVLVGILVTQFLQRPRQIQA